MFKIGAGKKKGVITPLILLPCKHLDLFRLWCKDKLLF